MLQAEQSKEGHHATHQTFGRTNPTQTPGSRRPHRRRQEWLNFIANPRGVVVTRQFDWSKPIEVYSLAGTIITFVVLCMTVYVLIFGPITSEVQSSKSNNPSPVILQKGITNIPPTEFVDWGLRLGFGLGILLPEGSKKKLSDPQFVVFYFGAAELLYKNVIPAKLYSSGSVLFVLHLAFTILLMACIHPIAILLKGTASFTNAVKYGILLFSYTFASVSLLYGVTAIVFVEFAGLGESIVEVLMQIFVLIPMAGILLRGYFSGYSELYTLTKRRVALSTIGAALLSCIIGPLMLVPLLHGILLFQPYLDALV